MGMSPNGILCYGIPLSNDREYPWDAKQHGGDIERWWRVETGFVLKDKSQIIEEWYRWDLSHPLDFLLLHIGSGDDRNYILTLGGLPRLRAEWDETVAVSPSNVTPQPDAAKKLIDFCDKYSIERDHEPNWWLSSYYG